MLVCMVAAILTPYMLYCQLCKNSLIIDLSGIFKLC
jgi:hypothetical protein